MVLAPQYTTKGWYNRILGHLEQDILDILWSKKEVSSKEIFINIKYERNIALTTVFTVLERLVKRGLVEKVKRNHYIFRPTITKAEFARKVSYEIFKEIFKKSADEATESFVDVLADINPLELDRLKTVIERKKKEGYGG